MVESKHKKIVKRLKKSGKLNVYTKNGTPIPLNISGRPLRKKNLYPKKKQSLCHWLDSRHSKKKSNRYRKKSKLRGGSDKNQEQNKIQSNTNANANKKEFKMKVDEGKLLSKLEKQIVEKLNSIGLNTASLN